MDQNTYNLCLRHKSLHFKSLIFLFTNIVINFKTPKCFISNTFAFSPKRKYILLKTQVRFTSNALAFETKRTCVFRALLEGPEVY